MRTPLVIWLLFAIHSHAGVHSSDANETTSSSFNETEELAKMNATCMSNSDFEELTGNIVHRNVARFFAPDLAETTVLTIGLTELRATLDFAPLGPWEHYNRTRPSEEELAAAPTIAAYYDLKEMRYRSRGLETLLLLEKNIPPAIAYFDKRFPWIRTNFRRRFEDIRQSEPVIDRKTIDRMIVELIEIWNRVDHAAYRMISMNVYLDNECFTG